MDKKRIYSNSVDDLMAALEAEGAFDDEESTEDTIEEVDDKSSERTSTKRKS